MAGEVGGILRKKKREKGIQEKGKGGFQLAKRDAELQRQKDQLKAAKNKMKKTGDALGIIEDHVLFEAGIIFWVGFAQCLAPRAAELAQRTMWRVFTLGTVGFM